MTNKKLDYRVLDTLPRSNSFSKGLNKMLTDKEAERIDELADRCGSPKPAPRDKFLRPLIKSKRELEKDQNQS